MVKKSHGIPRFLIYPLTDKKSHSNSKNLKNTRVLSTLNTLISISITRFRQPNPPFNLSKAFYNYTGTRKFTRKNFSLSFFSSRENSFITYPRRMYAGSPNKKTGTGSLFETIRFAHGDTVPSFILHHSSFLCHVHYLAT